LLLIVVLGWGEADGGAKVGGCGGRLGVTYGNGVGISHHCW